MGILNQQLGISEKATTNDIDVNSTARSLTAPSGYYAEGGKYPDNRSTWRNGDVVTTEIRGGEQLIAGQEAGTQTFTLTNDNYNTAVSLHKNTGGTMKIESSGITVSWDAINSVYASTWLDDGIAISQTAGRLS